MQAYCLVRLLCKLFPNDEVEIIDYRCPMIEKRELRRVYTWRPPFLKSAVERTKLKTLRAFLREKCPISSRFAFTNDMNKASRFVQNQGYDAIFVGSDTVWEVRENGGAPLAPNIYFLPNVTGCKKIAFAVSADQTNAELLTDDGRCRALAALLNDFDFKAVRDDFTFNFLRSLGVSEDETHFLPDPTLLWDFSDIVEDTSDFDTRGKPLAGVAVVSPRIREQATRFFQSRGFVVINILGPNLPGQLHVPDYYSLNQRLGVFSRLMAHVTDRFHGTIFALKLAGAPIMFIEPEKKYPKRNSKGRDLLKRLHLEHMVFHVDDNGIQQQEFEECFSSENSGNKDAILAGTGNLQASAKQEIEHIKAMLQ